MYIAVHILCSHAVYKHQENQLRLQVSIAYTGSLYHIETMFATSLQIHASQALTQRVPLLLLVQDTLHIQVHIQSMIARIANALLRNPFLGVPTTETPTKAPSGTPGTDFQHFQYM